MSNAGKCTSVNNNSNNNKKKKPQAVSFTATATKRSFPKQLLPPQSDKNSSPGDKKHARNTQRKLKQVMESYAHVVEEGEKKEKEEQTFGDSTRERCGGVGEGMHAGFT